MPQSTTINRRFVLAARPDGLPKPSDLRLETIDVPTPRDGEVLLRTLYLSLDPYMRNVMNEIGPHYASSVPLNAPMVGATISRVVTSNHPKFRVGDLVLANAGWQDYALSDGSDLRCLGNMAHPSFALGGLGMTGFTAYVGLHEIGQPKRGETLVVAAATGAVGSVVGQIAKLKGARVVGIASGAEKTRYAVEELGFDVCLDRRDPQFAARLAESCPNGIDVYFENVGGAVFDAVLPLLNLRARIPVCGFIAHYNKGDLPPGPNVLPRVLETVLGKRVRMEGFIILDHFGTPLFDEFRGEMGAWVASGAVKLREDVVDGLENAPSAFNGLLEGRNFGKLVVRVAET